MDYFRFPHRENQFGVGTIINSVIRFHTLSNSKRWEPMLLSLSTSTSSSLSSYVKLPSVIKKFPIQTRKNVIVYAIDYQIPVSQLSVLGALRECKGDRDIQVARRLFPRLYTLFAYNFLKNGLN